MQHHQGGGADPTFGWLLRGTTEAAAFGPSLFGFFPAPSPTRPAITAEMSRPAASTAIRYSGVSRSRLTTIARCVVRAITTSAVSLGSGFSSRCGR